jgi:hypothetical protein
LAKKYGLLLLCFVYKEKAVMKLKTINKQQAFHLDKQKINIIGIGREGVTVVGKVRQYFNIDTCDYTYFEKTYNKVIKKSLLVFVIYSHISNDDLSRFIKLRTKQRAIVGIKLQTSSNQQTNISNIFDVNWLIPYSKASVLTVSAGIKTLYGIGAIRSIFCVDFMDVISTLKDANHSTMEFVSLSSSKSISHLTGQLKYNINMLVDSVKCIFLFIYLSIDGLVLK